jgi:hypothetical protein
MEILIELASRIELVMELPVKPFIKVKVSLVVYYLDFSVS